MSPDRRKVLVLWDFDGTIADTVPLIVNAHHVATEKILGIRLDEREIRARIGEPAASRLESLVPSASVRDVIKVYDEQMRSVAPSQVPVFGGIPALISQAASAGLTQLIVTSRHRKQVLPILQHHRLSHYFEAVVGLEDTARHKPDPDPLRKGLALAAVLPAEAVYIGDAVVDVLAARAAGVGSVAVTWGAGTREALVSAAPCTIASDVSELRRLLVGLREETIPG